MSKFFDDEEEFDHGVAQGHADQKPFPPHKPLNKPEDKNGGVSDEAYLNDYRNRMPFHYIENGHESYYYWQYGATMEIEFEITDEMAVTNPAPPYIVDVRENGISIVDPETGIASFEVGSMAKQSASDYYTAEQTQELLTKIMDIASTARNLSESLDKKVDKLTQDLYGLIGQEPAEGDTYTVIPDKPFMMTISPDIEKIIVNGTTFDNILCIDASDVSKNVLLSLADLPRNYPFVAIYKPIEENPTLITSISMLPKDYVDSVTIPAIEAKAKISTHNLNLDETDGYPELSGTPLDRALSKLDGFVVSQEIRKHDLAAFLTNFNQIIVDFKKYLSDTDFTSEINKVVTQFQMDITEANRKITELESLVRNYDHTVTGPQVSALEAKLVQLEKEFQQYKEEQASKPTPDPTPDPDPSPDDCNHTDSNNDGICDSCGDNMEDGATGRPDPIDSTTICPYYCTDCNGCTLNFCLADNRTETTEPDYIYPYASASSDSCQPEGFCICHNDIYGSLKGFHQLDTPVVTVDEDGLATWEAVDGADKYYIESYLIESKTNTPTNSYLVGKNVRTFEMVEGETIRVRAVPVNSWDKLDAVNSLSFNISEFSERVTYSSNTKDPDTGDGSTGDGDTGDGALPPPIGSVRPGLGSSLGSAAPSNNSNDNTADEN